MKHLYAACLLAMLPTIAQANCILTRLANLNPEAKDWLIVSGDMKPALEPGDCVLANLAFTPDEIKPGAIIVFHHPVQPQDFIKRIVATEGQTVQMIDGDLHIDGAKIPRVPISPYRQLMEREGSLMPRCPSPTAMGETCAIPRFAETLAGNTFEVLDLGDQFSDNTGIYTVPEGHLFVMGDHRDNSTDTRTPQEAGGIGFVPLANVIGILTYP